MAAKTNSKAKKGLDQTIDEDVKSGAIRRVYLLFGEETYLRRQKKALLLSAVTNPDDNMNFSSYEGKSINISEIIDLAETMPFLAEYRVILIENSGYFKNAAPDELVAYLEAIPDSTCIIFSEDEVDKRSRLYKAVTKYGAAAEYARLDQATLSKWVIGKIGKEKKKISERTLQSFLFRCGEDMEAIDTELEKLFCYTYERDVITEEDLDTIISGQMTDNIFDMVTAFSTRDQRKAFTLYYELLEQKESPYHILFLVIRQMNQLLQLKDLRGRGLDTHAIAERTGSPDWLVRKNLSQANAFSLPELEAAVKDGVSAEEAFKTGRMDERTAVELFLSKYSG